MKAKFCVARPNSNSATQSRNKQRTWRFRSAESCTNDVPLSLSNEQINSTRRRVAVVTVVVPFVGSLLAIGSAWYTGKITIVEIGLLSAMYTLTLAGITVGFHRHFAHCAFKAKTPVRVVLAILGSMAAQGPLVFWVSTHRRHHGHSDQEGDPHSPHTDDGKSLDLLTGFFHAHLGWMFCSEITNSARFAKDLLRDRVAIRLSQLYFAWVALGLIVPAILAGILTGSWGGAFNGLLWGGLVRIFLVHHATWSINSLCHICGSRPFATRDHSTNNVWLAIPTLGEAWHNNHHAFAGSAIFGLTPAQVDIGAWMIRALEFVGAAWDVNRPSSERIAAKHKKK